MIRLSYSRLLAMICFVLAIGILASCHKNDNNSSNNGKAALYSFGPTGAKVGDTLRFIGINLDQVSSIKFTGVNALVDKAGFKSQSSDLITALVPATTEKGKVVLKLTNGDSIVTKTALNIGVKTTIASMTQQARPGANVTITGDYLNWIDRVTFNKNKLVTSFVSQSQSQLVVKVPDDAQTGTLVLHYGGTDSADLETKDTLKVNLPLATSMSPNPVKHGTSLTITGNDLDLVKKVYFTGVTNAVTTFVSQSATQLVVTVPASTTKGKIKLEAASGVQTTTSADLDVVLPAITGMSPNPVDTLTNLTITGTNLDLVSAVSFVGASGGSKSVTSFVSQTPTQLVVAVPGGVSSGKITLSVKNSTLTVKSPGLLGIVGAPPPPIIFYDEALNWNGWIGGGWGGSKDLASTDYAKSGTHSIKISYTSGGWGVPLQLGGGNYPIDGYNTLNVAIYADATATGKSINIGFNEQDGKTVTLAAGWNLLSIPLTQISSATTVNFLYFKDYTPSGDFTIYVDDLGIF
ncbi:MAG: IPT/TIG domain-containing protein [Flavisolibacter sp.]